ncbi:hypothetical protein DL764_004279 [Monosporascus ibericus]|uniref:Uncharacterized protein n=1 Tax=Monosporascus ibericus TaxID=155417 RepID=A0A4V1XB21_9PEZI|nr:hypothetical protein DL764_004279 [Monosporascus ibericus]
MDDSPGPALWLATIHTRPHKEFPTKKVTEMFGIVQAAWPCGQKCNYVEDVDETAALDAIQLRPKASPLSKDVPGPSDCQSSHRQESILLHLLSPAVNEHNQCYETTTKFIDILASAGADTQMSPIAKKVPITAQHPITTTSFAMSSYFHAPF